MTTTSTDTAPGGRASVVETLFALFRRGGFEGVSIADVSKATGLGKSSLYHYFPGGKVDMARAVLDLAARAAEARLFPPLRTGSRAARIDGHLAAVDALYGGGAEPCLIASLSVGADPDLADGVAALTSAWIAALTDALVDTGAEPAAARATALDAVTRVQGGLVVARALAEPPVFAAALAAIRQDLYAV